MSGIVNGYQSGLVSRSSAEWINIQKNTFTNWVNEQLKTRGLTVYDLRTDLGDGVRLVALLEVLQRRRLMGALERPSNQYEVLQNLNVALDAVGEDNVRIVNIGCTDLTEGNIKLVLALIWHLILRYQVGLSNIQHKNWMLAWIQAVIPECDVTNFTTDWNDGVALHALLDFCLPGLCPGWRKLKGKDALENCRNGIKIARQQFGIPLILKPEHLCSSELDDLSCITYLSYFMKIGSPGYNATLQRIQPLVINAPVFNFTTDWNDGRVLCELVSNLGADLNDFKNLSEIERLQHGLDGAQTLGVYPLLTAADIAEEDSEHLGIMAYASKFINMKPKAISAFTKYEQKQIIVMDDRAYQSRDKAFPVKANSSSYTVLTSGDHEIFSNNVKNLEHHLNPKINVNTTKSSTMETTYNLIRQPSLRKAKKTKPDPIGNVKMDTFSVGVIMSTTSLDMISKDDVKVEAVSPSGRVIKMTGDGYYNAQFGPDEIGVWNVTLICQGKAIDSCPVDVCDPSQVKVIGLKNGMVARANKFQVDCSKAGIGDLEILVRNEKGRVPSFTTKTGPGMYNVNFTPYSAGPHHVTVNFNRAEIRDDNTLLGSDGDEMHRRAIFSSAIEREGEKYKIKSSCDWQVDYVTGGPFQIYISDSLDIKVYSMKDGTICNTPHLIADCSEAPDGQLEAEITYGHHRFPATVTETKPNVYQINFRPRGRGIYRVWLLYSGITVKGSPFIVEIDELTSPKARGDGLKKGVVGEPAEFVVDARGFPNDLNVQVHGPHYPIPCAKKTEKDGTFTYTYNPEEVGIHKVVITMDGKDIENSPFRAKVVDPSKIRISGGWRPILDDNERIPLLVGKEKQLPFDASEAGPGELTADIHGPSTKIPTAVDSRQGGKHILVFTPQEEGKHYLDVKWDGFPLPRTPYLGFATRITGDSYSNGPFFQPVVVSPGSPRSDDSGRVRSAPLHSPSIIYMERPKVIDRNRPISPSVTVNNDSYYGRPTFPKEYTSRDSIPGIVRSTSVTPRDMSPMILQSTSSLKGSRPTSPPSITVIRKPSDVGISRKIIVPRRSESFQSETGKPFMRKSNATSPATSIPSTRRSSGKSSRAPPAHHLDPTKVILSGHGLRRASIDKPAVFQIDGKQAGEGEPEVKMSGVRTDIPVKIQEIEPKKYNCTYTPRVPGAYLLDIKWNKRPLKCCPFKIDVKQPSYPHMVNITGDPLKFGIVGKDIRLQIDPRQAGSGELTVFCKGPRDHNIPVSLVDNFDGTQSVKIKPVETGRHILTIKYGGDHVLGSPYAIDIKAPEPLYYPVKVYGPGITDGILPQFESHFMVDARGAGAGELHVSIMGPKGAFQVELHRTSQKDKLFYCHYNPVEPGLYTVNVRWTGSHVDGSPFKINLATSQEDLDRMIIERRASLPPSQPVSEDSGVPIMY